MGKAAGRSSIATRRWVWLLVAAAVIFVAGVILGAGAQVSREDNPRCDTTSSVVTSNGR